MSCTSEVMPIQDMVFSVLDDTDPSLRNTFEKNMLVTGGNSNLSGFDARLGFEINQKLGIVKLKTSGTFNRKFDAFAGGAVMATNPRFIWSWYSSQEYHDGSKRLHEL
uniref:Uncharacterized protein n=1 Tax=Panagrolaimus sp. JU765 TaxID=591449 RepID=A0AC34QXD1_9BILA